MNKFAKKLYYKFFDLYQYSSFLGSRERMYYANAGMRIIKENPEIDFGTISEAELLFRGCPRYIVDCIIEYRMDQNIRSIEELGTSIDDWIHDIIFPGFVDNSIIGEIIRSNDVSNRNELLHVIASDGFISKYGQEVSANYLYFIEATDWSEYPTKYKIRYRDGDDMITHLGDSHIYGNFHNHTNYSDGNNSLQELVELAMKHDRQYIGISDHSYSANGVNETQLELQLREIQTLNQTFNNISILRSLECEILSNGSLDMSTSALENLDYVIGGVHTECYQSKKDMENRLLRAIENPLIRILAHPSARIYKKKPPINVDLHKIIDACVQNRVVIEINGDSSRLDLDPRYIQYALDKGAYFTVDSDTHNLEGFYNINNAIKIAQNLNIPSDRCLNTFKDQDALRFLQTYKS